jgi:hypothetical protein
MKYLVVVLLPLLTACASTPGGSGEPQSTGGGIPLGLVDKYHLLGEMQIGYPTATLTNPDGTKARYDGVGLRMAVLVPVLDKLSWDIYLTGGVKYLDLQNTANGDGQQEVANVIGPLAGVAIRWTKFWFGAHYNQLWARHYATGPFSGRSTYNFNSVDYFAGLHYQFGRLGVGLTYSMSSAEISKEHTGLNSDTPYNDSMISLQFTFNTGETLWQMIKSLF